MPSNVHAVAFHNESMDAYSSSNQAAGISSADGTVPFSSNDTWTRNENAPYNAYGTHDVQGSQYGMPNTSLQNSFQPNSDYNPVYDSAQRHYTGSPGPLTNQSSTPPAGSAIRRKPARSSPALTDQPSLDQLSGRASEQTLPGNNSAPYHSTYNNAYGQAYNAPNANLNNQPYAANNVSTRHNAQYTISG